MLIQIESGDAKSPRTVRIEPDDGESLEFTAKTIAEAHKMIAQGRKDGWDSLRPKKGK